MLQREGLGERGRGEESHYIPGAGYAHIYVPGDNAEVVDVGSRTQQGGRTYCGR